MQLPGEHNFLSIFYLRQHDDHWSAQMIWPYHQLGLSHVSSTPSYANMQLAYVFSISERTCDLCGLHLFVTLLQVVSASVYCF